MEQEIIQSTVVRYAVYRNQIAEEHGRQILLWDSIWSGLFGALRDPFSVGGAQFSISESKAHFLSIYWGKSTPGVENKWCMPDDADCYDDWSACCACDEHKLEQTLFFWWIFCTESSHHNLNVCCLGFQSGHHLHSHVVTHLSLMQMHKHKWQGEVLHRKKIIELLLHAPLWGLYLQNVSGGRGRNFCQHANVAHVPNPTMLEHNCSDQISLSSRIHVLELHHHKYSPHQVALPFPFCAVPWWLFA